VECQNHLRQIGLAIAQFETAQGFLPSAAYGRPYEYARSIRRPAGDIIASTFTDLLPFIDQQVVADRYDWSKDWFAPENQTAVNSYIKTYRCPASPGPDSQIGIGSGGGNAPTLTAATGDYSAVYSWGFPMAVPMTPPSYDIWGVGALSPALEEGGFAQPRRIKTTDGASHTMTVVEQSDHGRRWVYEKLVDERPVNGKAWAPWAGESCTWLLSYLADGSTWAPTGLGPANVNANNSQGIFAFHLGGANVCLLDGSVHFVNESLDALTLFSLVTRARGESVEVPE
jgi:prepilin-type processing-associated H-X9-DG protein